MVENTKIEWCDHTFNPWEGCTKVGPGCDHCYAEARNNRFHGGNWGPGAPRRRTSEANWKKPLKWNRQAAEKGVRYRVFCASMADVFDNEVPWQWRLDLFGLIRDTPHLDWLLLTKRIGNVPSMLDEIQVHGALGDVFPNVWLGATIVNQAEADRDIPKLLEVPARVRFLSMEPLLGEVSLRWLRAWPENAPTTAMNPYNGGVTNHLDGLRRIDWVIVGGESGPGARPMHPSWVCSIRDQCISAGVPFLFKQWGEWAPARDNHGNLEISGAYPLIPKEWERFVDGQYMARVGKKSAGRLLDFQAWDVFPTRRS